MVVSRCNQEAWPRLDLRERKNRDLKRGEGQASKHCRWWSCEPWRLPVVAMGHGELMLVSHVQQGLVEESKILKVSETERERKGKGEKVD